MATLWEQTEARLGTAARALSRELGMPGAPRQQLVSRHIRRQVETLRAAYLAGHRAGASEHCRMTVAPDQQRMRERLELYAPAVVAATRVLAAGDPVYTLDESLAELADLTVQQAQADGEQDGQFAHAALLQGQHQAERVAEQIAAIGARFEGRHDDETLSRVEAYRLIVELKRLQHEVGKLQAWASPPADTSQMREVARGVVPDDTRAGAHGVSGNERL